MIGGLKAHPTDLQINTENPHHRPSSMPYAGLQPGLPAALCAGLKPGIRRRDTLSYGKGHIRPQNLKTLDPNQLKAVFHYDTCRENTPLRHGKQECFTE